MTDQTTEVRDTPEGTPAETTPTPIEPGYFPGHDGGCGCAACTLKRDNKEDPTVPPQILTPEEAAAHVADGTPEGVAEVHAQQISDATAQHAQWQDSRPHEEVVSLATTGSAVVYPPEGDGGSSEPDAPASGGTEPAGTAQPTQLSDEQLRAEIDRRGWSI